MESVKRPFFVGFEPHTCFLGLTLLFTPPEVSEKLMHFMLSAWQSHCKLGLGPTLSIEMGQPYVRQCPSL